MLVFGHPGLAMKTLYYCTLYSPIQSRTQEHSHLQRIHECDNVCQTQKLTDVTERVRACFHLWKFAASRFICWGLPAFYALSHTYDLAHTRVAYSAPHLVGGWGGNGFLLLLAMWTTKARFSNQLTWESLCLDQRPNGGNLASQYLLADLIIISTMLPTEWNKVIKLRWRNAGQTLTERLPKDLDLDFVLFLTLEMLIWAF